MYARHGVLVGELDMRNDDRFGIAGADCDSDYHRDIHTATEFKRWASDLFRASPLASETVEEALVAAVRDHIDDERIDGGYEIVPLVDEINSSIRFYVLISAPDHMTAA